MADSSAPKQETPLTVQQIIDQSSHCMVEDGAGNLHLAVKAKISDLRQLERALSASRQGEADVFKFLLGEAPLEGVWWGEPNNKRDAPFWWRTFLRDALASRSSAPAEPVAWISAPAIDALQGFGKLTAVEVSATKNGDRTIPLYQHDTPRESAPEELVSRLKELAGTVTEGPWAWDQRGEKINEWGLGVAMRADETIIAGHFDEEDVEYVEYVCSHEAATCNYKDPELICLLRNNLDAIIEALSRPAADREDARRWIPMLERMPGLGEDVLACWPKTGEPGEIRMAVAHLESDDYWLDVTGEVTFSTPSFWMPLPDAALSSEPEK